MTIVKKNFTKTCVLLFTIALLFGQTMLPFPVLECGGGTTGSAGSACYVSAYYSLLGPPGPMGERSAIPITVPYNTSTIIIFNNVDLNEPAATAPYNNTTGEFTAPSDGVYAIETNMSVQSFGGVINILKNGTVIDGYSARCGHVSNTGFGQPDLTNEVTAGTIQKLSMGDVITIQCVNNDSANGFPVTIYSDYTNLLIHQIA